MVVGKTCARPKVQTKTSQDPTMDEEFMKSYPSEVLLTVDGY